MIQTLTKNVHCTIFTCNERILLFILGTMALLFCGEVFDLVERVRFNISAIPTISAGHKITLPQEAEA